MHHFFQQLYYAAGSPGSQVQTIVLQIHIGIGIGNGLGDIQIPLLLASG